MIILIDYPEDGSQMEIDMHGVPRVGEIVIVHGPQWELEVTEVVWHVANKDGKDQLPKHVATVTVKKR